MLKLEDYGTIFLLLSLAGALAISTPALAVVVPTVASEKFSELYILGPNRMAEDYPFNVKANESYNVFLGIGNHIGSSSYYALYVKLRSRDEPLPNSTVETPSPLPALYEYKVILSEGEVWEKPLSFSFNGLSFNENSCLVETLTINGLKQQVNKLVLWDPENKGYYLELFFELWIYNSETNAFTFHNRFVGIWLNMTG